MSADLVAAEKRCSRCGTVKSLSQFSRNRASSDGLQNQCKDCNSKAMAAWRAKQDPEKLRARQAENIRRLRATNSASVERNRKQVRAQSLAMARLRDLHHDEYRHLLEVAKREVGL